MFGYCEFSLLLEEVEKWPRLNEVPLGLDYWRISWPTRAYFGIHDHALRISVVGWSGCGLGINGKRAGAGTNAVKNSGYFLACNVAVMLKIETRPGCTRTKAVTRPGKRKRTKKSLLSKNNDWILGWMLTFGFAMMISVKNLKAIKRDLCRFSMTLKRSFFFLSKFKRWYFAKTADFLFSLMEIPIWRTFYSMLTTDS